MNRVTPKVYKSTFLAMSSSDSHNTLGGRCQCLHFIDDENVAGSKRLRSKAQGQTEAGV